MTNLAHTPEGPGAAGATLRRGLLFGLALVALVALVHPDALLLGKVYGSADAANSDAFTVVGDAARRAGDYPEWNPYLFAGMPTFGSVAYQWGVYPPTVVMNWLQDSVGFPPLTWMLAHLLLGGAGMVWLLGRWGLPASARLLGAAAWLLFPRVVAWGVHGHGSKLVAAMYLPWLLGLAWEALDGRGRRVAGWAALLLGLQTLRWHPQITYYTLLALAVLLITAWIRWIPNRAREPMPLAATGWGAAAVAAGLLLAAVCVLPVHDYAAWSVRGAAEGGGASYEYATGWSLSPRELGTFVLPSVSGFGQATYQGPMPFTDYPNTFGVVVLALAVAAWLDRRRRGVVVALAALFALAVLVAFGKHLPVLYGPLYAALPFFNKMRIPSMILVLAAVAAAVAAALGAARLAAADGPAPERLKRAGLAALGAGALALLAFLGARGLLASHLESLAAAAGRPAPAPVLVDVAWGLLRADLLRLGLVLLAGGGGLLAAARSAAWRTRGLGWLLCALVVVELLGVDARITHPENSLMRVARDASGRGVLVEAPALVRDRAPAGAVSADPAQTALAGLLGPERAWPLGRGASTNDGMIAGVHSLGGYSPFKLAAYETIRTRLFNPEAPAGVLASWLAGARVVTEQPFGPGAFEALASLGAELEPEPAVLGDLYAYRNRSALPRARLLQAWRPQGEETLESFLGLVQAGRLDPAATVTLDAAPSPAPAAGGAAGTVRWTHEGLDEVVLAAETPAPAILVLADMAMPGWSVEVDGAPAALLRADHVLRAVALPAGAHEVRFRYQDPSLRRALLISAAGLLGVLVLLALGRLGASTPRRDA